MPTQSQELTKWEYHVLIHDQQSVRFDDLHELGKFGWELVSAVNIEPNTDTVSSRYRHYIFKRPLL